MTNTERPITFWDFTNTEHMIYTYERQANGTTYRAVLTVDDWPSAPDDDASPVVLAWTRHRAKVVDPGPSPLGSSVADSLSDALDNLADVELFARYVRAFHGGSVSQFHSHIDQGGPTYLAIVTRDMWVDVWGNDPRELSEDDASAHDWQAYVNGDVYVGSIQRAAERDPGTGEVTEWEDTDMSVGGLYGDDAAAKYVLAELDAQINHDARGMLPNLFGGAR